jgi:hypothetical protein
MGQADTALEAAAAKHQAACAARHALQKAVHVGAVTLLGLIGTFWHNSSTLLHLRRYHNFVALTFYTVCPALS